MPTNSKKWLVLGPLADPNDCIAAGEEIEKQGTAGSACDRVLQQIRQEHGATLAEKARTLIPDAQYRGATTGHFYTVPQKRAQIGQSGQVTVLIAFKHLSKSNGLMQFCYCEDESKPYDEWMEEELELKPGSGIMWAGGCVCSTGRGQGGRMGLLRFE